MDLALILTIVGCSLANIALSLSLFMWNRTEGNADRREFREEMNLMRRDLFDSLKDFHGRLCAIEEKRK